MTCRHIVLRIFFFCKSYQKTKFAITLRFKLFDRFEQRKLKIIGYTVELSYEIEKTNVFIVFKQIRLQLGK